MRGGEQDTVDAGLAVPAAQGEQVGAGEETAAGIGGAADVPVVVRSHSGVAGVSGAAALAGAREGTRLAVVSGPAGPAWR